MATVHLFNGVAFLTIAVGISVLGVSTPFPWLAAGSAIVLAAKSARSFLTVARTQSPNPSAPQLKLRDVLMLALMFSLASLVFAISWARGEGRWGLVAAAIAGAVALALGLAAQSRKQ